MSAADHPESGQPDSGLAPVIPLFGDRAEEQAGAPAAAEWRSTWDEDVVRPSSGGVRFIEADDDDTAAGAAAAVSLELAEKHLLKKLRVRSLSISESRAALLAYGAAPRDADKLIDVFIGRGYLDDAALAEQIVHVGLDRKGQGRRVIAQTLAKRGVPRDVADAALLALPDDDMERALEFARSKARSLRSLDRDTAIRRLVGQLARRGYGGSAALDAARLALDEAQPRGPYFS